MNLIKDKDKKFKFKCRKCGFCCKYVILYPFDIMNICKELNLTTKEFIKKCAKLQIDKDNILRCLLKEPEQCLFLKNNRCSIYESRPIRCRLFPLGRYFENDEVSYIITGKCIGFESNKKQSIQEFLDNQEVSQYDKLVTDWNNFIIKLKNSSLPLTNPKFLTMFTKIFYDFDNELIQKYKKQMNINSNEEFMQLLYKIADETLLNLI